MISRVLFLFIMVVHLSLFYWHVIRHSLTYNFST